jgi:hypothetical protein
MKKFDLMDVTFLIPVRIDSVERFENLLCVTSYILSYFDTNITVIEGDHSDNGLLRQYLNSKIKIVFNEDAKKIFHRTKYINVMLATSKTEIVAVWDTDVIVKPDQIVASVQGIRLHKYDFVYPYDGCYLETGAHLRRQFINGFNIGALEDNAALLSAPYTRMACGGGFFARKDVYQESGGENEFFFGWGPEDAERLKRWIILGKNIGRIPGNMFHLFHPRGANSYFKSEEAKLKLLGELDRITGMSKSELETEVCVWLDSRKDRELGNKK